MQFTRFFLFDGQIAHSDTMLTDTLDADLLQSAMQALQQLQSGAEEVSEGLPCTVRLGTSLPVEQWEWFVKRHPERFRGRTARQVKAEQDERCRKTEFALIYSDRKQVYELLREQSQLARASLHGSLGGLLLSSIVREGRRPIDDHEWQATEAIDERIWQAAPAVYTATSDFGTDLPGSFEMIHFSAYFAAAMLLAKW